MIGAIDLSQSGQQAGGFLHLRGDARTHTPTENVLLLHRPSLRGAVGMAGVQSRVPPGCSVFSVVWPHPRKLEKYGTAKEPCPFTKVRELLPLKLVPRAGVNMPQLPGRRRPWEWQPPGSCFPSGACNCLVTGEPGIPWGRTHLPVSLLSPRPEASGLRLPGLPAT